MRVAPEIILMSEERAELMKLVRSKLTSVRLVQRARIVLLAAQGLQNKDIAAQRGIGRVQVSRWRERCAGSRFAGIERDLPRGAPPVTVIRANSRLSSKQNATLHSSSRRCRPSLPTRPSVRVCQSLLVPGVAPRGGGACQPPYVSIRYVVHTFA